MGEFEPRIRAKEADVSATPVQRPDRVSSFVRDISRMAGMALPAIFMVTSAGCGPDGCNDVKPKEKEEVVPSTPSKNELEVAQRELFDLLQKFMRKDFDVDVPSSIKILLCESDAAYQMAAGDVDTALHSVGMYKDDTLILNYPTTLSLMTLLKVREKEHETISCSTLDSVGTLIHEAAHGLTKDFQKSYSGYYGYFTGTMHEALATEVEDAAPRFITMMMPTAIVPSGCKVGPAVLATKDQRFSVVDKSGVYQDYVAFETYLFSITGKCDDIEKTGKTWAHCSLKSLMNDSFDQLGAGKMRNAIMAHNPHCTWKKEYSDKIDGALACAEAPYLQYAVSRCDGNGKLEPVKCKKSLKRSH